MAKDDVKRSLTAAGSAKAFGITRPRSAEVIRELAAAELIRSPGIVRDSGHPSAYYVLTIKGRQVLEARAIS